MPSYRTPTAREKAKLTKSRKLMEQGIQGERDFLSKISTTMAKAARDDQKMAKEMYYSVPEEAREGEAYQYAGYEEGGEVTNYKYKKEKPEKYPNETGLKKQEQEQEYSSSKEYAGDKTKEFDNPYNDSLDGYKAGGMVKVRGQGAVMKTKGCKIY